MASGGASIERETLDRFVGCAIHRRALMPERKWRRAISGKPGSAYKGLYAGRSFRRKGYRPWPYGRSRYGHKGYRPKDYRRNRRRPNELGPWLSSS